MTVVIEVLVSVLVAREVDMVVEVTISTVETGVPSHRGISYCCITCLLSKAASR